MDFYSIPSADEAILFVANAPLSPSQRNYSSNL